MNAVTKWIAKKIALGKFLSNKNHINEINRPKKHISKVLLESFEKSQ